MIEFNACVRKPLAPRIFVNDIGGVYRLDGGIMQVTFVQKFVDGSNLNAVEQGSLIWPEANWFGSTTRTCCVGRRRKSPEGHSATKYHSSGRIEPIPNLLRRRAMAAPRGRTQAISHMAAIRLRQLKVGFALMA
jgi:hypothetical protein